MALPNWTPDWQLEREEAFHTNNASKWEPGRIDAPWGTFSVSFRCLPRYFGRPQATCWWSRDLFSSAQTWPRILYSTGGPWRICQIIEIMGTRYFPWKSHVVHIIFQNPLLLWPQSNVSTMDRNIDFTNDPELTGVCSGAVLPECFPRLFAIFCWSCGALTFSCTTLLRTIQKSLIILLFARFAIPTPPKNWSQVRRPESNALSDDPTLFPIMTLRKFLNSAKKFLHPSLSHTSRLLVVRTWNVPPMLKHILHLWCALLFA